MKLTLRWLSIYAMAMGLWYLNGCEPHVPPVLNNFTATTAYPRQILGVDGSKLAKGSVLYDVGTPNESRLSASFISPRYIKLPSNASKGDHPIALTNSHGNSARINVHVLSSSGIFPPPRIEDVGISQIASEGSSAMISIAVANVDIDATGSINGAPAQAVIFSSALPTDFLVRHQPSSYSYPVYHYGLLIASIDPISCGQSLSIVVQNNDGKSSEAFSYNLPTSMAQLDSDNDALLDEWEIHGYPVPNTADTIDLKAMGCDPKRKDILVEVDWIAAATP